MVVALTGDGAPANTAMSEELGCSFKNVDQLKTTFSHPATQKPAAAFLDPCHMFKTCHKCSSAQKINKGNTVAWQHIERLHSLQQKEGLHLANKLHRAHIQWQRQPRKVRCAAQVMSTSVATALAECRVLKVEGFADSQPSEEFLRCINNTFDALN